MKPDEPPAALPPPVTLSLSLWDLSSLQPVVARGLEQLLEWDGDVEQDFGLSFEAALCNADNSSVTEELMHNGASVAVTTLNRNRYVSLYVDHVLVRGVAAPLGAFRRGFCRVMSVGQLPALSLSRAEELMRLVCGDPAPVDLRALELVASYAGGFGPRHPVVCWFWQIVHSFTPSQKRQLLLFTTGSERVPLAGLAALPLVVQRSGDDSEMLPVAHTCSFTLDLPSYSSRGKLQKKLVLALQYARGFGLV